MPELPEVETVCRGLSPHMTGKTISKVTLYRENLRYPFPAQFVENLENRTITKIQRRAKYIEIHLDNGQVWITHLGMTGVYLLCEKEKSPIKHTHMIVSFDDVALHYVDPRRFGYMDLIPIEYLGESAYYKNLGPEPFSETFNPTYIAEKLSQSKKPIKTFLMDNSFVVGVGNIYACEILFKLKINPETPANQLFKKLKPLQKTRLSARIKQEITDTLKAAIKAGGATISDFRAPDSTSGYFPIQFKVYGRENELCFDCKCQIKRIIQAGRSTFYCPSCQK